MRDKKILCWNVNGIRAVVRNGFLDWLDRESPDILCLQETRASPEQIANELIRPHGYYVYWSRPEKKGYSGVATFTRERPIKVEFDLGVPRFDIEGRVMMSEHHGFVIFNVYFPNGKRDETRLQYKLDFYDTVFEFVEPLRQEGKKLIICGDFNTAHKEIDLARPKENEKISGFLPVERAWLDKLVLHGYVDVVRRFNREPGQYTWWDPKTGARERNVGWRIDYFFATENLLPMVSDAFIMPDVMGSDHCPVGIKVKADAHA